MRFRGDLKAVFRRGRGRALRRVIEELNLKLRGWMNYYRHIAVPAKIGSKIMANRIMMGILYTNHYS